MAIWIKKQKFVLATVFGCAQSKLIAMRMVKCWKTNAGLNLAWRFSRNRQKASSLHFNSNWFKGLSASTAIGQGDRSYLLSHDFKDNWHKLIILAEWSVDSQRKQMTLLQNEIIVKWMKQIITKKLVLIRQTADSFTSKILSFETVAKREAILNPVPKQRISLFRVTGLEPIRTHENHYPLIWWILILNIAIILRQKK